MVAVVAAAAVVVAAAAAVVAAAVAMAAVVVEGSARLGKLGPVFFLHSFEANSGVPNPSLSHLCGPMTRVA